MAALLRLVDLGVQPQLIASAVNVVISQRLVRRLCDHCKTKASFTEAEQQELRQQTVDPDCLFTAKGCKHCHRTGFSSRTGVFDVTLMDRALRTQLLRGDVAVSEKGHSVGDSGTPRMTTMQVRGTQLALTGMIPWEEVERLEASID
jgi:type II secretory ATPase GspE/PulE/Tfp pilus assembly ATPase PilB-like protein